MYALAIHGGAGAMPRVPFSSAREQTYRLGLMTALAVGERVLKDDGAALDAVQAAVMALEDDAAFNAGHGAVLTAEGTVELDAAIMDGSELRAGAVAQLRQVRNPILLARHVLDDAAHVFLVGDGAERFARDAGMSMVANDYFITAERRQQFEAQEPGVAVGLDEPPLGTVGAVARDRAGRLAAATSTGGTAGKRSGRVGDSPVIGAGTYADNQTCAVSTTGHGEWFLRTCQAYDIAARLRYGGGHLTSAVAVAIARLSALGAAGGLIAVDPAGEIAIGRNTPIMFRATVRAHEAAQVEIY
ncbi:MAG TPA: isoaspartyl peptidase/L-asparaginase [Steroidobacteraceae bacterium]|jgi:beta-aspartyl-peptidase (threonine type)